MSTATETSPSEGPYDVHTRAALWRGKVHVFDEIDPRRTAHIVVDLQNGFLQPGAIVEVPQARSIIPKVNAISSAVRVAGGLNIFLQYVIDDAAKDSWSTWFGQMSTVERTNALSATFASDADGFKLHDDVIVTEQDLVIPKSRFGGFVPAPSELERVLMERQMRTVIITGTATNVCCETTAREAMQRNYQVIFVSDATAALTQTEHDAALLNLSAAFADVRTAEETIALLAGRMGQPQVPVPTRPVV